jgi:glutamate-1-semialdehyde 2,1-aminomutase
MNNRYAQSERLYEKACKLMPGGVNSPVRAFKAVGGSPVFFARGEGSEAVDADGNRYADFCGSWGPLLLGHAHPAVVAAASEALTQGLSFGACSEREIILAELLLSAFPEYERARFVSSGTEAVMTAIRLARGATGRNKILKFDGCYHGHADHLLVKAGSGLLTQPIGSSPGVPDSFAAQTLVASLDDEAEVESLFNTYGDDIAAVILEPLPANSGLLLQRPEFLSFLREITTRYGALLIFDEVISGFRLRFGGYMHEVGLTPDLVTLGKIVGGGMPVGAVVGPADLMEQLAPSGRIYQAGTLSGNPVAMAAGAATLKILSDPATYRTLAALGAVYDESMTALRAKRPDLNWLRVGSISWLYLTDAELPRRVDKVASEAIERYNHLHRAMLDRGYYLAPSAWEVSFTSTAHTPEQILGLAAALDEVLA